MLRKLFNFIKYIKLEKCHYNKFVKHLGELFSFAEIIKKEISLLFVVLIFDKNILKLSIHSLNGVT